MKIINLINKLKKSSNSSSVTEDNNIYIPAEPLQAAYEFTVEEYRALEEEVIALRDEIEDMSVEMTLLNEKANKSSELLIRVGMIVPKEYMDIILNDKKYKKAIEREYCKKTGLGGLEK